MTGSTNGLQVATNTHSDSNCDLCDVLAACEGVLSDDSSSREIRDLSQMIVNEDLLVVLTKELAMNCRYEIQASERRCHQSLRIIMDSGASSHMFPCKDLFDDLTCTVNGMVSLGKSDYKLRIVGQGTTAITALETALWVPGLSFGLISISKFDKKGNKAVYEGGKVVVTNEIGEVVLTGKLDQNLYYLDEEYLAQLWGVNRCTCLRQNVTAVLEECDVVEEILSPGVRKRMHEDAYTTTELLEPVEILHRRLGHASLKVLKKAFKNNNYAHSKYTYQDIKNASLKFCPSCYEGKMKAFSSPDTSRSQEFKLYEKFGIDYKGPFPVRSVHGHTGFYLLCDYASSNVFAFPCKSKDEEVVQNILHEYNSIVQHAGKQIKILQCDYDSVLLGAAVREWMRENNIKLQTSAPYTHWQNGFIEAMIGKVMDKARSIMAAGRVPRKYWSYAILCACYLINRLPVRNSDTTPYEMRYGVKPDINHIVPFFCPGVYHKTPAERKGAWDYKAERCRMLGYDERMKNSYFVLVLSTGKIISRHDCKWNEEALESVSMDNQNGGDPYEMDPEDETDPEEDVDEVESPMNEVVDDYDEDEPYWKSNESVETANLLERWLEDVSDIAARKYASDVAASAEGTELKIPPLPPVPRSVEEALAGPDADLWREALKKELRSFEDRNVFVEAPQEGRAMRTKIILRTMYRNDYTVKYKARLVACGYSQIYGVDYKETYAPTASTAAVMVAIQIAAMQGLEFSEFDVTAAFLEGTNDFPNFARLPKALGGMRVEVKGNFYGEKQGPKIWNDHLHGILVRAGFSRCPVHPCLYKKLNSNGKQMWIVIHVDDGLIVTSCKEAREEFLKYFRTQVRETTHLDVVGRYVGMDFDFFPEQRKVLLSHKLYISQKWSEYNKNESIPMNPTSNLRTAVPNPDNSSMLHDTGEFRFMCDRARPDMLVVTGELATGGDKSPSNEHKKVAEKAKHYLKSTQQLGLCLGGLGKVCVFGYSDASWVTDGNCKSRLGGCVFLSTDSGAVRSFSKNDTKPSSLSHSSCEAEIKAMDEWVREVMHIMDMYSFMCGPYTEPVLLFVDNMSAIELCQSLRQSHKVKHINMRIHFIREMIEDGFLELYFVSTENNVADVLTKPLPEKTFISHRKILLEGHGGVLPTRVEKLHVALNAVSITELTTGSEEVEEFVLRVLEFNTNYCSSQMECE